MRYPVIGTYRSFLWVVLHNERILRDKRNLISAVFVLAFLCLLAVYIRLLCFMSSSLIVLIISLLNILLVETKELLVETHRVRTHFKFCSFKWL